ncbi:MAG: TolC family protein, partial [Armatimonadetes bacterium]|nr:TolC family protein [Armatimonadota bacterium]
MKKFSFLLILILLLNLISFAEDFTLEKALEFSFKNNPFLKSIKQELEGKEAVLASAKTLNLPQMTFSTFLAEGNMNNIFSSAPEVMPQSSVILPEKRVLDLNFNLMLPVYTGGKINSQIKSAEYQKNQKRYFLEEIENELSSKVKEKYFEGLLKIEEIKIYQDLVRLTEALLERSQHLYTSGKIPLFYHLRAKNELAESRQKLNDVLAEKEKVLAQFKALLGKNQKEEVNLIDDLKALEFKKEINECLEIAKINHPQIKAQDEEIKTAQAEVKIAQSAFYPQVYLGEMYDWKKSQLRGEENGYTTAIIGSLAIFDFGKRKALLNEKEKNYQKTLNLRQDLVLAKEQEVVENYKDYEAAYKNIPLSQAALEEAQEVFKAANLRYESGKGIFI